MLPSEKIILFDGVCVFCNFWVDFIIKRDKNKVFKFALLQSNTGKNLVEKFSIGTKTADSIIMIEENRCFIKSTAVLRIVKDLNGLWQVLYILRFIPPFFRDSIYDFIAENRYKLFGRRSKCRVPSQNEKNRFIF